MIYIISVIHSDDGLIYQNKFNTKKDAQKEFNHQFKDSKENYKNFDDYDYAEKNEMFATVVGFDCHTDIYLRSYQN